MISYVTLYTDGACSVQLKAGGWAYILSCITGKGKIEKQMAGFALDTTNNRMELNALLEGLKALKAGCIVDWHTDSKICIGWLSGSKINQAEIRDTVNKIRTIMADKGHEIRFNLVAAHSGIDGNERCDQLAVQQRDLAKVEASKLPSWLE